MAGVSSAVEQSLSSLSKPMTSHVSHTCFRSSAEYDRTSSDTHLRGVRGGSEGGQRGVKERSEEASQEQSDRGLLAETPVPSLP